MVVHLAYSAYIGSQKSSSVIVPLLLRTGFLGTHLKGHSPSNPEYNSVCQALLLSVLHVDTLSAAMITHQCTLKIYPQATYSQIFIDTKQLDRIKSEHSEKESLG